MKNQLAITFLSGALLFAASCKKELPDEPEPTPVSPTSNTITGTTWANVGAALSSSAYGLSVFDNKLFIAGNFTTVGSAPATGSAYWDGSAITPIYLSGVGGTGFSTFGTHNNMLFGGGGFSQSFGPTMCAAWNGTTWTAGSYSINSNVYAIQSFNNNLYIGGYFTTYNSTTYNRIAMHNGSSWQAVGSGFNNTVNAMAVYNNELYAAGDFTSSGATTVGHIAKWNGSSWVQVGTSGINGSVKALTVFNGELYAAGSFTQADGNNARYIAKWNGTTWSNVGGSITGGFNGAKCLCVYNGELFVGGDFTTAGSVAVVNVARWNGTAWSAMGTNNTGIVTALAVYNGSLYGVNMTGNYSLKKFQ